MEDSEGYLCFGEGAKGLIVWVEKWLFVVCYVLNDVFSQVMPVL